MDLGLRGGAIAGIAIATLAIGSAYAAAAITGRTPSWAPWAFAAGIDLLILSLMTLGVARTGRGLGKLAIPFALIGVILAAGFGALLVLPPADPADPTLWLGLPPRAAVVLYAIGFLPVLVLPLAYALTFDELTLSDADLARARAARRGPPEPR